MDKLSKENFRKKKKINKKSGFRSVFINDEKKISIITLRKCGSSTIDEYISLNYKNIFKFKRPRFILNDYNYIKEYKKYIVIRDPIKRFISAFKYFIYDKKYIGEYLKETTKDDISIKINNFVDDIKNKKCIKKDWYNKLIQHWKPYLHLLYYENIFLVDVFYDIKNLSIFLQDIDSIFEKDNQEIKFKKVTCKMDIVINKDNLKYLNNYYKKEYEIYNKIKFK